MQAFAAMIDTRTRAYAERLPRTDALLSRSLKISIGVSDPGLGSAVGVTMRDGLDVVEERDQQMTRS